MKRRHSPAGRQDGLSLLFALMALVALTVGAVALIRSVDSGVLALGNLSFKQSGVASGARGTEAAVAWVSARLVGTTLDGDVAASGYYATSMDSLDATRRTADAAVPFAQVDWDDSNCVVNGKDISGSGCLKASPAIAVGSDSVRYVITRLCSRALPTNDATNNCAVPVIQNNTQAATRGSLSYSGAEHLGDNSYSPYFRIITRTLGPKGTVAYTETLFHF